jgi:hypothetical protein
MVAVMTYVRRDLSCMSETFTRSKTGHYGTEQQALNALVVWLIGALEPHAIWLFGSRAHIHPGPFRGGWPFALAKSREGVAPTSPDSAVHPPSGRPSRSGLPDLDTSRRPTWAGPCRVAGHLARNGDGRVLGLLPDVSSRARRSAERCDADTGTPAELNAIFGQRSRVCAAALHAAARTG